jgi:hypothetical protein
MFSNSGPFWAVRSLTPFLLALGGVSTDFLTTQIGLTMGLREANPNYHPMYACVIFFTILYLLTKLLPPQKLWKRLTIGVALVSYFGTVHNILVLLGIFSGIIMLS